MTTYFIAINGKVYAKIKENTYIEHADLTPFHLLNDFEEKENAYLLVHIIDELKPLFFYGKPRNKKRLYAYARGDKAATGK